MKGFFQKKLTIDLDNQQYLPYIFIDFYFQNIEGTSISLMDEYG